MSEKEKPPEGAKRVYVEISQDQLQACLAAYVQTTNDLAEKLDMDNPQVVSCLLYATGYMAGAIGLHIEAEKHVSAIAPLMNGLKVGKEFFSIEHTGKGLQ